MTPPARTQAAIELLDAIIDAAREGGPAADSLIGRYFATRRYAGSGDRRAIRELVYAAVRACGERPPDGRAAMLALARADGTIAATFDGSPRGAAPIDPEERMAEHGVAPAWLIEVLSASGLDGPELEALVSRAPLDIRVNTLLAEPDSILAILGGERLPGLPEAIRLERGRKLDLATGLVEIQDAGSQIVSLAAPVSPGMRVIDLCAGSGGKSLALAARMQNAGSILATDTDRARLARLAPRAHAAGVTIIECRLLDPSRERAALGDWTRAADVVMIDAPCSGTGTWRRNPETRWRLTGARLERLVSEQRRLLRIGTELVRPGGSLVYVVCSLLDQEGAAQMEGFLSEHSGWRAEPLSLPAGRMRGTGIRLTPARDATDGFFVARLLAPC